MNIEKVIEIVQKVGFPVVIAGFLIWTDSKNDEISRQENYDREKKYVEMIYGFQDTLNNFNVTLKSIDSRLEVIENEY